MYTTYDLIRKSLCFIFIGLFLVNCTQIPDFGDTPEIRYDAISQSTQLDANGKKVRENITITIRFEDGDGNLGASAEERGDSIFQTRYGKWGNYELVTETKSADGVCSERIFAEDSIKWFPILKSEKIKGPIKGNLDLNFSRIYGDNSIPIDVKFKVRIRDRSLNASNQIETDVITVPGYR